MAEIQHGRELRRGRKHDFLLQPPCQGHGVEIADRANAERVERTFKIALALQIGRALLPFKAVGHGFSRFRRGHAQFGRIVRIRHRGKIRWSDDSGKLGE